MLKYILVLSLLILPASADDYLKSWIPATCCVTNDCCWEIKKEEVKELDNEDVEVVITKQIKKKMYSPDGKYYRCACDYTGADNKWIVWHGANTRCVFVPQPGS